MHVTSFGRRSLALLAMSVFVALPASAQVGVTVTINGAQVDFEPPPIIQTGRVFVPLRGVFERLGASVVYSNGTINATGNGRDISLQIGSTQATVNGETQTIDVAPFIVGASTFVPLRFVSQALGAGVDWDNANRIVAISMAGAAPPADVAPAPQSYSPDDDEYADQPPPPIPVYEQPYVPAPNYIWQPGYWAWGPYGYYWIPGTWVQAPQTGYVWTPGYWSWNNGGFAWSPGYWATAIGFYGGVNYGAGYYGNGYVGGAWSGNVFRYNSYVTRVNVTIVHNVYVNRNVYVNNSTTRISYNGGPHGVQRRASPQELAVAKAPHLGMTVAQRQHIQTAVQDRSLLASVNHNRPPVLAVARPLSTNNRPAGFVPVRASDRVAAPAHAAPPHVAPAAAVPGVHPVAPMRPAPPMHSAPAMRPAPAYHTPVIRPAPANEAPTVRPVPAYHTPMVRPAAPNATPAVRPAPAYHTPFVRPAPVNAAPEVRPAPAYHTPYVRPAPANAVPPARPAPAYHTPMVRPAPANAAPPARPAPAYHTPIMRPAPAAAPARAPRPSPHPTKPPA